jgi:uncharacterized protein
MSGLIVDVSDLVGRPGATRHIRRGVAVPGLRGALGWVDDDSVVQVDVAVDSVPEGVVVTGTVSGTMHLSCSRCLVDYDRNFDQAVDETFYLERDGRDDDDGYAVAGDEIDLEPMVRDVIVLGIPPVPLHDEACRGLCTTCGGDLNLADCGHTQTPADLRWAPLQGALAELRRQAEN